MAKKYKQVEYTYDELLHYIRYVKKEAVKVRIIPKYKTLLPYRFEHKPIWVGVYMTQNLPFWHIRVGIHELEKNKKIYPNIPNSHLTQSFRPGSVKKFIVYEKIKPKTSETLEAFKKYLAKQIKEEKDYRIVVHDEANNIRINQITDEQKQQIKDWYNKYRSGGKNMLNSQYGITKQTYDRMFRKHTKTYNIFDRFEETMELKDIKKENLTAGVKEVEEALANEEKEFAARQYRKYIDTKNRIDRDEKMYIEQIKDRRDELEKEFSIFTKQKK
jgi:hypothetical protein